MSWRDRWRDVSGARGTLVSLDFRGKRLNCWTKTESDGGVLFGELLRACKENACIAVRYDDCQLEHWERPASERWAVVRAIERIGSGGVPLCPLSARAARRDRMTSCQSDGRQNASTARSTIATFAVACHQLASTHAEWYTWPPPSPLHRSVSLNI